MSGGIRAIIPVGFRRGTVITYLAICCHQRIECDCVSGLESMQANMFKCDYVVYNFVYVCVPRLFVLFHLTNQITVYLF